MAPGMLERTVLSGCLSAMKSDYIPFNPAPTRPRFVLPKGSVDAHCHVFGPADRFPFAPERKYTPVDAPKEQLFALRDLLGFERNVIVQATCHGYDNSALLDALAAAGGKARGVASVRADIGADELSAMNDVGVRGVRFNFVKRLVDVAPADDFLAVADLVRPLGWHVVVYFESHDIDDIAPFIERLDCTVVVDHMGRPDIAQGVESPRFGQFIELMDRHENVWCKVSCPERLSVEGPPYDDVVPFASLVVERFPDRVLWGTDWPHPNMVDHMPDDGALVDFIPTIAPRPEQQQALLVDNPTKLYWR